jgi:uncharacterized SAM-binding protein YcdF (DUF218 family)
MFVFLSKFVPLWIYPLGLASLLLLAILLAARRPRLVRALASLAFLALFLGGNRWVSAGLARSLEWQYLPPAELPSGDVIVVLGGGTLAAEPPRPSVEVNGAGDRVLYAVRLYQQGVAPRILLSGGYIEWLNDNPVSPAEDMAELMTTFGVPADALWLQPDSQNTHEDALYSTEILRQHGISRILLVTSAMHMPRSVALFEKLGFEVVPLPTDYTLTERLWADLRTFNAPQWAVYLVPSASNLSQTSAALKEYIGLWMYRLQGWL